MAALGPARRCRDVRLLRRRQHDEERHEARRGARLGAGDEHWAYIVMALYSYGLHSYGLYSHGLYSYGLHSYGLYSYCLL